METNPLPLAETDAATLRLQNLRLLWELHVLNEIAESVAGSLDLDVILHRTLQHVARAFDTHAAAVRLRDEATGMFEVRAQIGLAPGLLDAVARLESGQWPSDRVVMSGEPVIVRDLRAEPWARALPANGIIPRAALVVPIVFAGQLIGTLKVTSAVPGAFGDVDRHFLMTIAHHLGIAVGNARLYSKVSLAKVEWERTCDAIGDVIGLFGADGRLVRANTALAARAGWPVTSTRPHACDEVGFCGCAFPDCAVGRAVGHRQSSHEEITTPDGQIFLVTTLPIEGGSGRLAAVQLAKNVTEEIRSGRQRQALGHELAGKNAQLTEALEQLRAAQAQLVQVEKLSAIGQLVAGVAHELNNPLTSIIGFAQLVGDGLAAAGPDPSVEQAREDVQRIAEESERAARIVKNLLAFARQQAGDRALQALPELLTSMLELRTYDFRLSGIELQVDLPSDLPPVWCDANQLQQGLLNIVLNAEQAILERGGGGHLDVRARYDDDADAIVLSIADDGPGIAPELLSRVFDPFFTTKPVGKGTGLGLSLCYGIIRDHGGNVWVESEPGVRTTFWIELPARRATAPQKALRLLVAHSDPHAGDFVAAVATGWGHRVAQTSSARVAFDRLARESVDAMIVDRGTLAQDPDGWQRVLGRRESGPRLIALSLNGEMDEIGRLARQQAVAVVDPPFRLVTLRRALRALARELVPRKLV